MPAVQFLTIDEVVARVRRGKTWIWQREKAGKFPHGRRVGDRSVRYLSSEIDEWMRSLPSRHDKPVDWGCDVSKHRDLTSDAAA